MIVWGGLQSGPGRLNTGGIYDPASDRWTLTSTEGAPGRRDTHTAVWTGKRMIVWGGKQSIFHTDRLATGGMYDPAADTWTPTATAGVPAGREEHSAVWTGKRMIVWGGRTVEGKFSNDGALFDPVANAWEPMPMEGAPTVRATHPAVWTGKWMLVWSGWGGVPGGGRPNTGALFGPAPDWTADPCGSPS